MKMFQFVFVAFVTLTSFVHAQDKLLTLDDIFSTDPRVRVNFGGNPTFLEWTPDGRSFRQVRNGELVRVDAITGQATKYFDTLQFVTAATKAGIGARSAQGIVDSNDFKFNKAETAFLFVTTKELYVYNIGSNTVKQISHANGEEKEFDFSPDGRRVSFVRGNNLFVADAQTGTEKQLTRDGSETVLNGYLDWVYEEELYGRGQKQAYWWSPDSNYIAFLRLDESTVPKFVIPNDVETNQDVENTNYPKAGDPNPTVRLGIAQVTESSIVPNVGKIPQVAKRLPGSILRFGDLAKFVDVSGYRPEDLLIVRVAWSPDSKCVFFQAQNREQTFLDLNVADLDGKVTKQFTEISPAWVGINDNPFFLKDGSYIWESERDGFNHLYHYDANGKLIRRITEGRWEVRTGYGVNETAGYFYFSGMKDSWIAENIYRVKIGGGPVERLTSGEGWHSPSFDPSFTQFVDNWSDVNTPIQTRLYKADGSLVRVINENRVEALSQYKLGKVNFLQIKTRDGFPMEAMMILPPDFDATKKYPVLSYNYSGPHGPSVEDQWAGSRNMWHQMMAQKGYIIWILDNRTASGKGQDATWPVYKNFGELELRDLEDGVTYLKSLKFVDGSRIGLWGWSYGGFMATYALTHSKSFKIGIAGGIVSDWHLYDSIYTERYMLKPENNRDGYDRSSLQNAARNLSGRLLLIHGAMDNNVHMQNTTQLVYELQKADKQFDMMIYPTQRHGFSNPAQIRHWYTMMTDYVLRNL